MDKKIRAIEEYTSRLNRFSDELYEKYVELNRLLSKAPAGFDKKNFYYRLLKSSLDFYNDVLNIYSTPSLSRIVIDNDFRITLPYYKLEIKLSPLPKSIYLFYLLHPEGICNENIASYSAQIHAIYRNLTRYERSEDAIDVVEKLVHDKDVWARNLNKLNKAIDSLLKESHDDSSFYYKIDNDRQTHVHRVYLDSKKIILNDYLKEIKKESSQKF